MEKKLKKLEKHMRLSGYKAVYSGYFHAVKIFIADFMAADIVKMLKDEGYDAWSELTGRVVGSVPESAVYAR